MILKLDELDIAQGGPHRLRCLTSECAKAFQIHSLTTGERQKAISRRHVSMLSSLNRRKSPRQT
jgi:hypothetical protein